LTCSGATILLASTAMNCVALSNEWNPSFDKLNDLRLYRHTLMPFWGGILMLLGVLGAIGEAWPLARWRGPAQFVAFTLWLAATGWLNSGSKLTAPFPSPLLKNSKWQQYAGDIDRGQAPICVPVDPFAWGMYGKGCHILNPELKLTFPWSYPSNESGRFSAEVPPSVVGRTPVSIALVVRPAENHRTVITARARIRSSNSPDIVLLGRAELDPDGGMIVLTPEQPLSGPLSAASVEFELEPRSASPMYFPDGEGRKPAVSWMGR
jgi:hypothetical protein